MADPKDKLIHAVRSATRKLAGSGNFDAVLNDVLSICVEAVGASGGTIYLHDPDSRRLRFQHVLPHSVLAKLPMHDIADDFGMAGAAFQSRQTVLKVLPERTEEELNAFERATGVVVRSIIATPLAMEDEQPIGVVQLLNKTEGCFTEYDADVLESVAAVATMAYLNYRLTEESSRASALLGMGKVSHDIGNLAASLYANLGFAEFAAAAIQGHLPDDSSLDLVTAVDRLLPQFGCIREALDRIVGYSRLISDLSAGRELRPDVRTRNLSETVLNASAYLEPAARVLRARLDYDVAPDIIYPHDEGYLFRIVQNLITNALKAVEEVPVHRRDRWVRVRLSEVAGAPVLEITDSGPGMSRRTIEQVLNGSARSQWDHAAGSGWGTKIVLELAATHGAKLEIESPHGRGATFRLRFPKTVPSAGRATAEAS
jgi:signal transduction histidine kinase